jgi:hypothetical protein
MKFVSLLTGLVIAGEALALLVGMHFLSERNNPWISLKNDLLFALDILTGSALIASSLRTGNPGNPIFWVALGLALLAHIYRDWETLSHAANPFCLNLPLFVVNNVKLVGLLSIILLATIQSW